MNTAVERDPLTVLKIVTVRAEWILARKPDLNELDDNRLFDQLIRRREPRSKALGLDLQLRQDLPDGLCLSADFDKALSQKAPTMVTFHPGDVSKYPNETLIGNLLSIPDFEDAALNDVDEAEHKRRVADVAKATDCIYFELSDGSKCVIFPKAIQFRPSRKARRLQKRGAGSKAKKSQAITVWGLLDKGEDGIAMLACPPSWHTAAKRFERSITLDCATIKQLVVGQELAPTVPLVRAYDPRFEGLAVDEQGNNCLTDWWTIFIPLQWPSDWSRPCFDSCRGLRVWRRSGWLHIVNYLEGKPLKQIEDVIVPDEEAEPAEFDEERPSRRASDEEDVKLGQCYDGGENAEQNPPTAIPPWFLWDEEICGEELTVVDSPLYGKAIRVMTPKAAREFARAQGKEGGKTRARLRGEEHTKFWKQHDPEQRWKSHLTDFRNGRSAESDS